MAAHPRDSGDQYWIMTGRKTIYDRFPKEALQGLPVVAYGGTIYNIICEADANKAVDFLLRQDILGMDTETRPNFSKGAMHKVALLQVATRRECFLFRLNRIGVPPSVVALLSNTRVPMIGLSWHDDLVSLLRRQDFTPGRFIDIQNMVGSVGIKDLSLQKIYANLFRMKISKRQRLTNWEADALTPKQQEYAAIDAWATIMIYDELKRLNETRDYEYIQTDTAEEPQAGEP